MKTRALAALWPMLLCCGCMTLTRGTSQQVDFVTVPAGATVIVDGKSYCAPATVALKRNDDHEVMIHADGCQPIMFRMHSQINTLAFVEWALPGGTINFGTDLKTGAAKRFRTLEPICLPMTTQPTTQPVFREVYRGQVLTPEDYEKSLREERARSSRFMGMD